MRWKELVGSSLVIVGSGLAGAGFGKKDSKLALIGTFTMGLGALFISDAHADAINQHAEILNEHEERLREVEQGR